MGRTPKGHALTSGLPKPSLFVPPPTIPTYCGLPVEGPDAKWCGGGSGGQAGAWQPSLLPARPFSSLSKWLSALPLQCKLPTRDNLIMIFTSVSNRQPATSPDREAVSPSDFLTVTS